MNTNLGTNLRVLNNNIYPQNATKNNAIKDKMRNLNNNVQEPQINSILANTQNYAEQLRVQRQKNSATALKIKKLKYSFKNISSRIIRSKTSLAAKQAAGQAHREVMRLKREKATNSEENTEIDAAIIHAKAMERIAKKKARHLEEEEMAKASGGPCLDNEIEKEEPIEEVDYEEIADISDEELQQLMSEFADEMQEMMSEMGLDELTDSMLVNVDDMDPADLEQLKTKHRSKEMREILKADMMYLKAVFDGLERAKGTVAMPMDNAAINTAPAVDVMSVAAVPQQSTIDIML